jgi:hypothetical protein
MMNTSRMRSAKWRGRGPSTAITASVISRVPPAA